MKYNFSIYVTIWFTCCQRHLHYLAFQSLDYERIWWMLFKKLVVCTKLYSYAFISCIPRYIKEQTESYVAILFQIMLMERFVIDLSSHIAHNLINQISHFLPFSDIVAARKIWEKLIKGHVWKKWRLRNNEYVIKLLSKLRAFRLAEKVN